MEFLAVAESAPPVPPSEPTGGVKREREEEMPQPLGEPQEKRPAVAASGMDPLSEDLATPPFHDFASSLFNPHLDLEGRPMEQPLVPETPGGGRHSQHLAVVPLATHVPSPEFVTQAAAFRDPVLNWEASIENLTEEDRFSRLEVIRVNIEKRKHEIMAGYDAERERLHKERARVSGRLALLQKELALANPEAEWRAAMRDPISGIHMLSHEQCLAILQRLMQTDECKLYFCQAVDPVAQGIHAYFEIIDRPMDLGKVMNQLKAGHYDKNTDLFIADVRLVFRNCECFNARGHEATTLAVKASEMFERAIRDPQNYQSIIKTKSKAKKSVTGGGGGGGGGSNALSTSASKISTRPAARKYLGEDEDDEEMARAKKGSGDASDFDNLQLTQVRLFCDEVTRHPGSLKKKKLAFFKGEENAICCCFADVFGIRLSRPLVRNAH
jgi:hypothetical protein